MQSIRTTFRSLSRSAVIVGTVLALGIAGCSTASDEATSTSDDVAVGGRLFSTADSATAALGSDAEPGQFPAPLCIHAAKLPLSSSHNESWFSTAVKSTRF